MPTLLLTLFLLLAAIFLMAFKVLIVKGGRFPEGHAHEIMARRKQLKAKLAEKKTNK